MFVFICSYLLLGYCSHGVVSPNTQVLEKV